MLSPGPSVLVLYESFAVGAALHRRLLDLPMVHLVRAEHVAECSDSYDVVVVDPYVREHRRAEVLRRWAGADPRTPVIELRDIGGGAAATLLAGSPHSDAADAVLSALRLDAAAA
jgi:hypothetical protein